MRLTKPEKATANLDRPTGLPLRRGVKPAPPFYYVHHPEKWYWCDLEDEDGDRFGWLPQPSKVPGSPGANGVRDPRGGAITQQHMLPALNAHAANGALVIQPNDHRLGPYLNYQEFYPTQNGGRWYVEPGAEASVLPNGTIRWNSDDVIPAVRAFHKHLRDNGLTHPLMREVAQQKIAAESQTVSRLETLISAHPSLAGKLEAARAKVAAMQEDYDAYELSLQPVASTAPKKGARKGLAKGAGLEAE